MNSEGQYSTSRSPKFRCFISGAARSLVGAGAALLIGACSGNYSNQDLDFQAALPRAEELSVKMQMQNIVADSAEWYVATRNVGRVFNGFVTGLLSGIDQVRAHPPTSRNGDFRTWGPFLDATHPGWESQVEMQRLDAADAALGFKLAYKIQVRTVNGKVPWLAFVAGEFAPSGRARRGYGSAFLNAADLRQAGYVIDEGKSENDLSETRSVAIQYQTEGYPLSVKLSLVGVDASGKDQTLDYEYKEEENGQGLIAYSLTRPNTLPRVLKVTSRWLASSAGRADVSVPEIGGPLGIECWGEDTRATFVRHPWEAAKNKGDLATCVLGAL